jgi:hypothetical protein
MARANRLAVFFEATSITLFCKAMNMAEVTIMTQTPGLVVFEPVVLADFIVSRHGLAPNVLESFSHNPSLGNEAIAQGCLLPIYSIPAWDYHVRLTEAA